MSVAEIRAAHFQVAFLYQNQSGLGLRLHRPSHAAAGTHGDEVAAVADGEAVGHGLRLFHQGDGVGVFRQTVEAGAVFRGEGFEFVE